MNLEKLFEMQAALDHHIQEKHQLLDEDLFNKKILALLVEVGELANETRCFKFWSIKPSSEKAVVLEEFVDGVHFILSLGIECGFHKNSLIIKKKPVQTNVNEQFLLVFDHICRFQKSKAVNDYLLLFESYLALGSLLGMTDEEMEQAYFYKNEVNYQRQENNY